MISGAGAGAHFDVYLRQRPGQLPGGAGDGDDPAGRGPLPPSWKASGYDPGRADRGDAGGRSASCWGWAQRSTWSRSWWGCWASARRPSPQRSLWSGAWCSCCWACWNDVQRRGVRVWFVRSGGGRVRPGALPLGGVQNKRAFQRMLKEERKPRSREAPNPHRPGRRAQVKTQHEPEGEPPHIVRTVQKRGLQGVEQANQRTGLAKRERARASLCLEPLVVIEVDVLVDQVRWPAKMS